MYATTYISEAKETIKKDKLTKAVGKSTMPQRHIREAEVQLKSFLTSALD
jgi:hypothetical protein